MSESRNSRDMHTPGPWVVSGTVTEMRGEMLSVNGYEYPGLALVSTDADADLIAAAPDLLASLNAAVAAHHQPDDCEDDCWAHEARRLLARIYPGQPEDSA